MKKKLLAIALIAAMAMSMAACSSSSSSSSSSDEKVTVKWAQGSSGNVLVSIAKDQGYFDEVGVEVEEIPLDDNQTEAVRNGQVDIASNSGTWEPLQAIASGDDIAIIGGNMLTGCMPVVAKKGTKWNGVEDFLGKTIADSTGKSRYALYHELVEKGYDIDKEITFKQFDSDKEEVLQALLKGEVDYAVLGTNMMNELKNTDGVEIVTYCSDVTPNYSCCRMFARDSWVKENKETVKKIDEALIRAMCYFESHRKECVKLMAKQLEADEDYVSAYMLDEHYRINPDPVKNIIMDNYNYALSIDGVENIDKSVNIEDHIYSDIYEEALEEATEKWGSEDKDFYKDAATFFKKNNK
jgi:NitT/TauT family transport system substrate-binding protein